MSGPRPLPTARPTTEALTRVSTAGEDWADAIAGLVRSHRARLTAADPSRPWLSVSPASRVVPRGNNDGVTLGP
jgi:hypothetical protein